MKSLIVSLVSGILLIVSFSTTEAQVRRVPALSLKVHERYNAIMQAIEADDFVSAQKGLTDLMVLPKLNKYEQVLAMEVASIVALKNDNMSAAAQSLRNILYFVQSIPPSVESHVTDQLAQIHLAEGDWQNAIRYGDHGVYRYKTLTQEKGTPVKFASLFAQAYYNIGDYEKAQENIDIVLSAALSANMAAKKEIYYLIALDLQWQSGNVERAFVLADELASIFPTARNCGFVAYIVKNTSFGDVTDVCDESVTQLEPIGNAAIDNRETKLPAATKLNHLPQAYIPHEEPAQVIASLDALAYLDTIHKFTFKKKRKKLKKLYASENSGTFSTPYEKVVFAVFKAIYENEFGDKALASQHMLAIEPFLEGLSATIRPMLKEWIIRDYIDRGAVAQVTGLVESLLSDRGYPFECVVYEMLLNGDAEKYPICRLYIDPEIGEGRSLESLLITMRRSEVISILPTKYEAPIYPIEALKMGTEGHAIVELQTDKQGHVITNRVAVIDSDPFGVFDNAAKVAARQFEYPTVKIDGKNRPMKHVRYKFVFEIN